MPAQAEQINGDDVLYMLVDESGQLLQAIGTTAYFWHYWSEVTFRMTATCVMVEVEGAVIVLEKLFSESHITSS